MESFTFQLLLTKCLVNLYCVNGNNNPCRQLSECTPCNAPDRHKNIYDILQYFVSFILNSNFMKIYIYTFNPSLYLVFQRLMRGPSFHLGDPPKTWGKKTLHGDVQIHTVLVRTCSCVMDVVCAYVFRYALTYVYSFFFFKSFLFWKQQDSA